MFDIAGSGKLISKGTRKGDFSVDTNVKLSGGVIGSSDSSHAVRRMRKSKIVIRKNFCINKKSLVVYK